MKRFIWDFIILFAIGFPAAGQSRADSLRKIYDFPAAVTECRKALENELDSLQRVSIEKQMAMCQNGLNMMDYCSSPKVISRRRFSIKDFFLHYPLADRSWHPAPNQLDTTEADPFVNATFLPEGARSVYFSAKDKNGVRGILHSEFLDTLWSLPTPIWEESFDDAIFPMLSSDGKTLYFSSKGLFGMGGYDLYTSEWDSRTKKWGKPVNMGFPYSSPFDDFLYINSDDGNWSIFASNRKCSRDSVYIYVLEYDSLPIRRSIDSVRELRKLADLSPWNPDEDDEPAEAESVDPKVAQYLDLTLLVRSMRDSMYRYSSSVNLAELQKRINSVVKDLQEREIEFIRSGGLPDTDKLLAERDKGPAGEGDSVFSFVRKSLGDSLRINIEQPEPTFDYTFKILPEGQFADDNTLPDGIVYQIQFMTSSKEVGIRDVKGLSPVFVRPGTSVRYAYSVGRFQKYSEATACLPAVKKAGFKSAFIIAFKDGKPVSVTNAKSME